MASEMLLDNNHHSDPIPINHHYQHAAHRKSGPIVEISGHFATMSIVQSDNNTYNTYNNTNNNSSYVKSISLDGDVIIQFPAKKKRRNRNNKPKSCVSMNNITMPMVMIN
jgi:hypothetical protein